MSCPCGVGKTYESCCEPIIKGQAAKTAEALMRARYTAYTKHEIDFVMDSLHPAARKDADRNSTEAWSKNAEWHGLEVIESTAGDENDDSGEVEFVARFSIKGVQQRHHERAQFKKHDGAWMFYDGEQIHPGPAEGPHIKLGRNDKCPCDSGKKYKKCCSLTFNNGAREPAALVRAWFTAMFVGDWDYLPSAIHPEAKQPTYPEQGEVSGLKIEKVTEGDSPQVSYSFALKTDSGESKFSETATLKQHDGRWMYFAQS